MEIRVKKAWEMGVWTGMEMQREKIMWKNCVISLRDGGCSATALILMQAGNAVTAH